MSQSDKPHSFLQENLLSLLCHDDVSGKIVSNLVTPDLFEGDYRVIAERAIDYWRAHGQAPKTHTSETIADILSDNNNRRAMTFRRILLDMAQHASNINVKYVLDSVTRFVRTQKFKAAILKSAERINSNQEMALAEIEVEWQTLLRSRDVQFNPGLRLDNVERVVKYLQTHTSEFVTGIKQFDEQHVVPGRGEVFVFLGPAKAGKSWFATHVGVCNLQQRKKIVYISGEMSEEAIAQRHYQTMFSISKREASSKVTNFEYDLKKVLTGFKEEDAKADFTLSSPWIKDELLTRVNHMGTRTQNLYIKQFPTGSITINGINAYLDNLESTERFTPDILILDQLGNTKTSRERHRIDLGRNFIDLRGLLVERNLAGICLHQISKAGALAYMAKGEHAAEDWSIIGTGDIIATYSQTTGEYLRGLARLFIDRVRNEKGKQIILISQNYTNGQFCRDSILMRSAYDRLLRSFADSDEEAPEEDED